MEIFKIKNVEEKNCGIKMSIGLKNVKYFTQNPVTDNRQNNRRLLYPHPTRPDYFKFLTDSTRTRPFDTRIDLYSTNLISVHSLILPIIPRTGILEVAPASACFLAHSNLPPKQFSISKCKQIKISKQRSHVTRVENKYLARFEIEEL